MKQRKSKLPIDMASMNKIKSIDKIGNTKSINANTEQCTPKYLDYHCERWSKYRNLDKRWWIMLATHWTMQINSKTSYIYENGDPFVIDLRILWLCQEMYF
jgi:hypothetical protein